MAGESVKKILSASDLGDAKRVNVTFPTTAAAAEGVELLIAAGAEITIYRSTYNPDKAAEKRANDKALLDATKKAIASGKSIQEILVEMGRADLVNTLSA